MIMTQPPQTICLVNSNKQWGGGEKWHYDAALALLERGYKVMAVVNHPSELGARLKERAGVKVVTQPVSNISFLNPLTYLRLAGIFRLQQVQAVLLNLPLDIKIAGLAARMAGVPKIIYRRGISVPVRDSAVNRFLYRRVLTDVIVNSRDTKAHLLQNNPSLLGDTPVHLLYNGIDPDSYADERNIPVFHREPGELLLGNVGRLVEQKGQIHLIELARLLKKNGRKFRILVAGKGPLEGALKARAKAEGVQEHILFMGFVENMKTFYRSIDILVQTSLWEGFGYAALEAMAAGKPVAAFAVSSLPEVVKDAHTGLLAQKEDVPGLAKRVAALMDKPAVREKFGAQGRERVRRKFHRQVMYDKLETILS